MIVQRDRLLIEPGLGIGRREIAEAHGGRIALLNRDSSITNL